MTYFICSAKKQTANSRVFLKALNTQIYKWILTLLGKWQTPKPLRKLADAKKMNVINFKQM